MELGENEHPVGIQLFGSDPQNLARAAREAARLGPDLIDLNSGEVIEFVDPEIEALQEKIAEKLGYRLKGHKLELYGVPIKK